MPRAKNKKKLPSRMPNFRRSLFWDADPRDIDPKKHARYIIERILDFGNNREVRWMWRHFPYSLLADVVINSRILHNKSRNFWRLMLPDEIKKLSKKSPETFCRVCDKACSYEGSGMNPWTHDIIYSNRISVPS